MTQSEKRTKERIRYEHTIIFRTEKTILETIVDIRNISMNGVYVATDQPLDTGTKCSIEIRLHEKDDHPIILLVEGIVSRVDGKGLGIKFTGLDENNNARLRQVLSLDS